MSLIFPDTFADSPVSTPNSITAPTPVTGATGGGGGGGLTQAQAQAAFTAAAADDENVDVTLLDDGTGTLFLQVILKKENQALPTVAYYSNTEPLAVIPKPPNEGDWKEPGTDNAGSDITTIKDDVSAIKTSLQGQREFDKSFFAKDLGGGNYQYFISKETLNEETGTTAIAYFEMDSTTALVPPALPWLPATAVGGGASISTVREAMEGTGNNANFPNGEAVDRLQLVNTANNPPTILGVAWLNPITGLDWGSVPAAGDVRLATGRVDELIVEANVRQGENVATPVLYSNKWWLQQILDAIALKTVVTQLETTQDVVGIALQGETIERIETRSSLTNTVIGTPIYINRDSVPQLELSAAQIVTYTGDPNNFEAGPTSTSAGTDALLTQIRDNLATAFGTVGDAANPLGAIHSQLSAIEAAIAAQFEIVRADTVYTAIQNNGPAGVTSGNQYRLQTWANGDTEAIYRTAWTDLENNTVLSAAQVTALDVPNDFDANPVTLTLAINYSPQDWIILPLTGDPSGLTRGAIARELVSQDSALNPPIWINPDTDAALATAPNRGNLADVGSGFPEPLLVRYRTIGGALDLKAYLIDYPNSETFDLFSNVLLTVPLTVGTTAGEVDATTLTDWDAWQKEAIYSSIGKPEDLPASSGTLNATPATAYNQTALLKGLLIEIGSDLDNAISLYKATTTETIGAVNLIADVTPLIRLDNENETEWYTDTVPRVKLDNPPTDPYLISGAGGRRNSAQTFWDEIIFDGVTPANNLYTIGTSVSYSVQCLTNASRYRMDTYVFRRSHGAVNIEALPSRLHAPKSIQVLNGTIRIERCV